MEYVEKLPLQEDAIVLEGRNGRAIDGNIYYILKEVLANAVYENLKIYLVAEDEVSEQTMRRKLKGITPDRDADGDGSKALGRVNFLRIHSREYYRVMATAGYIINDASIGNFFIKKEGQRYLNVWHGTPLKNMGRKVLHEPHATGNVQKNFIVADYLLYPSDYMMEHMIEDYMIANLSAAEILMGGYPRNGIFFDEEKRLEVGRELTALHTVSGKSGLGSRIYAYMPTWRPSLMGEHLQKRLEELDEEMNEGEIMFVNVHPLAEETVDLTRFKRLRPFPDDRETYEVLNAADGLLTDYSSVFYDFANTGRPIVLLTDDEEEYFETRGLYEPLDSLPFPKKKTVAEAVHALRDPAEYDDSDFMKKYCSYESAGACEKLVREFVLEGKDVHNATSGMEHRPMPSNGRDNVLIFGGDLAPGMRTDRLMGFLREQDASTANYFLTFRRRDLKDRYDILFDLPEGIDYIGRAGTMWMTDRQREAAKEYNNRRITISEYRKTMGEAFSLQARRNYGDMRVDRIIWISKSGDPVEIEDLEELEFLIISESM